MSLNAGWLEKNDWAVVYQVLDPHEIPEETPPLRGREWPRGEGLPVPLNQEMIDLFRTGPALITDQDLPEGAKLLLFLRPSGDCDTLAVVAENLYREPLLRPGKFRLSLRIHSIQETPVDWDGDEDQIKPRENQG